MVVYWLENLSTGTILLSCFGVLILWIFYRAWMDARLARSRVRCHDEPVCDNCGYDLRASPERCPECGQFRTGPIAEGFDLEKLRHDWPADLISGRRVEPWHDRVVVYETVDMRVATGLTEQLRARGIWCEIIHETHHAQFGAYRHSPSEFTIRAVPADVDLARAVFDRFRVSAPVNALAGKERDNPLKR